MKILITILLALFISSNANSQGMAILERGEVIAHGIVGSYMFMISKFNSKIYRCEIDIRGSAQTQCEEAYFYD